MVPSAAIGRVVSMPRRLVLLSDRSGLIAARFCPGQTRGITQRVFLVGLVALIVAGCGSSQHTILSACRKGSALRSMADPLVVGARMSLARARLTASFPVAQANVAIAHSANLTAVWVSKKTHQVALVYGGGDVTVMMTSPAPYRDPTADFSTFIRENHATARLGTVDGTVALVISPHTDVCHDNSAWVEFDRQGVDINVVSAKHGTAALLAVAQSLDTAN